MGPLKRYLFELTAWLPPKGVERWSTWVSDEWLADVLRLDPDLDRVVEFEPGDYAISDPRIVHQVASVGGRDAPPNSARVAGTSSPTLVA